MAILLVVCAVAVVVVFLMLPGESSADERAPFWGVNFAHRGLHSKDKSIPENSLAAFTAAVDAGYGIELDLQLTADGEVVVFHDDDLWRVCGVKALLRDYTLPQLEALRLHDTDQCIPTLRQVLAVVDGRIPMIIELKNMGAKNRLLCEAAWRILRTYDGDFCVESFDPRIVRWFKKHTPGLLRGQLAAPPRELGGGPAGFVVGWGLSHFMGRPQFIAYQKGRRPFLVWLAGHLAMRVVWTARPEDDTTLLELDNDAVIFEYYLPEPRYADPPGAPADDPADEEYRF